MALDEPHLGLVVLRACASAVGADGVPALDGDDELPSASAPPVQQALFTLHGLEALVLSFDFDGLPASGDGADPPDFEVTDARGLVQWYSLHDFPFRTWCVQERA